MTDFIKLGMMKAEFEDACRAIDAKASEAGQASLQSAWQALLAGDTTTRNRFFDKAASIDELVTRAKIEAWFRIGEKHGIPRDAAERMLSLAPMMH